jgi:hypothetical protein
VKELAADRIPVTVTCRVLKLSRQPYYRWLADPIADAEVTEAYRANALFDAHKDDPEFGHRLLADEARDVGESMADRTAWRIASENGWWSAFGKKRGANGKKAGPPVHDDLVQRDLTAERANHLWLTDITEHWTGEGKLYLSPSRTGGFNRSTHHEDGDGIHRWCRLAEPWLPETLAQTIPSQDPLPYVLEPTSR